MGPASFWRDVNFPHVFKEEGSSSLLLCEGSRTRWRRHLIRFYVKILRQRFSRDISTNQVSAGKAICLESKSRRDTIPRNDFVIEMLPAMQPVLAVVKHKRNDGKYSLRCSSLKLFTECFFQYSSLCVFPNTDVIIRLSFHCWSFHTVLCIPPSFAKHATLS